MDDTASIAINGSTKLLAIIGDPIAQAGSPGVFNPRLKRAGLNAVLVPLHVPQAAFEEAMRGLMHVANLAGIILTLPFKHRALALVDHVGETGRQVGAVNTMRREPDGRWSGDMFDGIGLVRAIRLAGRSLEGQRVLLLGAGGAGTAIAPAFTAAGARAITLFDPDAQRAEDLAKRVRRFHPQMAIAPGTPVAAGHDIIVNASPAGMRPGDGLPAPLGDLSPQTLVIDIIPKPEVTPLIASARAAGCQTIGGLAMLEAQADTILEFFGLPG
jgi:shikimate dehydrogenase